MQLLKLNTKHVSLTVNAFNNAISNFIYYRKLESVKNGGDSSSMLTEPIFLGIYFQSAKSNINGC